jgi:hypothetical protein
MATDLPRWKSDARSAGSYLVWTGACLVVALGLCVAGVLWAAFPLFAVAGLLAFFGHAENPLGWSGAVVMGVTIGCLILGLALGLMR